MFAATKFSLELFGVFCKLLPEQTVQYDLVSGMVKLIAFKKLEIPVYNNRSEDHLGYINEIEFKRTNYTDPNGSSKVAAIDFIADTVYMLSQEIVDFVTSEKGFDVILKLKEEKPSCIAISKLYANLFAGDIDGAMQYVNYLFIRYLEHNSQHYLCLICLFLNRHNQKMRLLQVFLEFYLSMIPNDTPEETIKIITFLLKMLKKLKYEEIISIIPNDKIIFIQEWLKFHQHIDAHKEAVLKLSNQIEVIVQGIEFEEWDQDEEVPEKALQKGSKVYLWDRSKEKWLHCEVIDNLHNEMIILKSNYNGTEFFVTKTNYGFQDIHVMD